jgi:excisionase family DNA binding protein
LADSAPSTLSRGPSAPVHPTWRLQRGEAAESTGCCAAALALVAEVPADVEMDVDNVLRMRRRNRLRRGTHASGAVPTNRHWNLFFVQPPTPVQASSKLLDASAPHAAPERLAYTVEEAAVVLGIGRDLIYDEIRTGRLRSKKAGARRIIARHHLLEWLDSN